MASEFDESDFVDRDFQAAQKAAYPDPSAASHPPAAIGRPPNREELEARVNETQQRLAELKLAQERLERERAALEEARRRRVELQTGREEMLHHLTRGIALLEQAEFKARQEAEQMAKTLADFQAALGNVQTINEETWTQEDWDVQLSRALAILENARMEWNSARLKWLVLDETVNAAAETGEGGSATKKPLLAPRSFGELCKLGLAFTWPPAAIALLALVIFLVLLLRR